LTLKSSQITEKHTYGGQGQAESLISIIMVDQVKPDKGKDEA
jgi:hypothetical protein